MYIMLYIHRILFYQLFVQYFFVKVLGKLKNLSAGFLLQHDETMTAIVFKISNIICPYYLYKTFHGYFLPSPTHI